MLAIFLIYWIGKKFYDLAGRHNRSQWGFAILGVVIYYATQFFAGIILYLIAPEKFSDKGSEMALNILCIAAGILVWHLVRGYLTKKWENEEEENYVDYNEEISNIGQDLQN